MKAFQGEQRLRTEAGWPFGTSLTRSRRPFARAVSERDRVRVLASRRCVRVNELENGFL